MRGKNASIPNMIVHEKEKITNLGQRCNRKLSRSQIFPVNSYNLHDVDSHGATQGSASRSHIALRSLQLGKGIHMLPLLKALCQLRATTSSGQRLWTWPSVRCKCR